MKRALVLSTLYPNPVNPRFGTFVARSIEALAKPGDWRVTVVNPIGLPPLALGRYRALADLPGVAEEGGITVHRPHFSLIPRFGARLNAAAIARAAGSLVRRLHAETPFDIVDAQFFFPDGPAAAIIARELGLPLSIKARGGDITFWGLQAFARTQMVEAARQAAGLLAVSRDLAAQMAAMGMPEDRIALHYTGLDRDRFRPFDHPQLRRQLSDELGFAMPTGVPLLACVGALIPRKGQAVAIKALHMVPDARLVLIGKGEDEAALRALTASEGLTERVFFAGSIDHDLMPLLLSAADVMVLPTNNEGLANAWVEALACGTPVVTCDVGGARELIASETAGRLVERTPEAVAAAVNAILAAPPAREAVAALTEGFSWDANAAALAAHWEGLVA
ncbi:glycosyltransferase [Erythrobacter sp. CCH5-A1]|uniref:glycosyltransferase n=1 Tax=Erythrobacter sp. CCH5-A1 TaxID=1768792 RepID=UPI000833A44C|nr:glycosyltransferase [Erythrobacter sp. CCH5-A1]